MITTFIFLHSRLLFSPLYMLINYICSSVMLSAHSGSNFSATLGGGGSGIHVSKINLTKEIALPAKKQKKRVFFFLSLPIIFPSAL